MKINKGDKVSFLNDVGGGVVTKILDKDTALVLNEHDFEVPILIKELIVTETSTNYEVSTNTEKVLTNNNIEVLNENNNFVEEYDEEEEYSKDNNDINIYLAFIPQDEKRLDQTSMDFFLINDSNYNLQYNILQKKDVLYESNTGKLEANAKELLKSYSPQMYKQLSVLVIQILYSQKSFHKLKAPFQKEIKIKPFKFFKSSSYKENDFFHKHALLFTVTEESFMEEAISKLSNIATNKIIKEKEIKSIHLNKPKTFKKVEKIKQLEVDLHIHELLDTTSGLSKKDILDVQMDKFRKIMKHAIDKKIPKVVFIHGVGNGVLKLEIRKELDRKFNRYKYQDASFKEYGYGATLVIIYSSRKK